MKLGDFCQTNENSRLRGYGGLSGVTEPTVRILALRRTNLLPTVSHLSTGWEKCPRKSSSPAICGSERNASRSVTRSAGPTEQGFGPHHFRRRDPLSPS